MRKVLSIAATAAIAALTLAAAARPGEAQVIYPWCAHYQGRDLGGAWNCGFTTYAQCMATVSGIGGWCGVNPWYEPPADRRLQRRGAR